jgi:PAS domain S-box-containing protein
MIRVLVLEDGVEFFDLLEVSLKDQGGFVFDRCGTIQEVVEKIGEVEFDALMCDEMDSMGASSIDLLRNIRNSGNELPIFVFVEKRGDALIDALNSGANGAFSKDTDMMALAPDVTSRLKDAVLHHRTKVIMERNTKVLRILNELIMITNRSEDPRVLMNEVLDQFLRSMDFSAGGIYMVGPNSRTARLVCHRNLPQGFIEEVNEANIDEEPYRRVFSTGQTMFIENYAKFAEERAKRYHITELCSIPLLSHTKVIGCVNVVSRTRTVFTKDEKMVFQAIGKELGSSIERLNIGAQLRAERQNLLDFMNNITDMHFVLDMKGNVISINSAVTRALGYEPEDLLNQSVLLVHVPDRREEAAWIVGEMIAKRLDVCRVPLITKDGTPLEVETRVNPGNWNGQEVIFGVTRDMTAQHRMEESIRAANKKLLLCSDISQHDIKNQVAILSGIIEIDLELTKDDAIRADLETMRKAVNKISDQLAFTKDYTRIGMNAPRWHDLEKTFRAASRQFQRDDAHVDMNPMPYEVLADPLLERVFYNLLDNSMRHGKQVRNILASARLEGSSLIVSVEDDGVGIPDKEKAAIFSQGVGRNTGYGLFFVKEALGLTNVGIEETGTHTRGARFEMTFPAGKFRAREW